MGRKMEHFRVLLERLIESRGLTEHQTAKLLGCSQRAINTYRKEDGSQPNWLIYRKLIEMTREADRVKEAEENYDPDRTEPITLLGVVAAGDGSAAIQKVKVEAVGRYWEGSPLRSLTEGPVYFFTVVGRSMEPFYPDGTRMACAKPRGSITLPARCPCVVSIDQRDATFKLVTLRDTDRGQYYELMPLNLSEHSVENYRPHQIEIEYIAIGQMGHIGRKPPLPPGTFIVSDFRGGGLLRESDE